MSANPQSVGIDHPTVVPANFDPEDRADDGDAVRPPATDADCD
ncbi:MULTISPECIES: hypothetical protein [Halorubrum]|nr:MULTISPECIES: hypothetical protein [Halorubrum]